MSLIYVTGAPGSGKTTLQKELISRGYDARDIDSSDLGGPHHKSTGKLVVIPPADQRDKSWFEAHEWRVYVDAFQKLKIEAKDKDIILCGVAAGDHEVLHLFDKILYLSLDDETLSNRLRTRIDNDYGKNEFELEEILTRKHGLDKKYTLREVVKIDATNSLADVVDEIISYV